MQALWKEYAALIVLGVGGLVVIPLFVLLLGHGGGKKRQRGPDRTDAFHGDGSSGGAPD